MLSLLIERENYFMKKRIPHKEVSKRVQFIGLGLKERFHLQK
jgi:hypothetical protein